MADSTLIPFGPRPRAGKTSPPHAVNDGGEPRPAAHHPPADTPRRLDDAPVGADRAAPALVVAETPAGAAPLSFTVPGRPLPAGSKTMLPIVKDGTVVGRRIAETGNRAAKAAWRADIRHAAIEAMAGRRPFTGPVAISIRFYLRRPKHHTGTGRNTGVLKASAPKVPITAPDVLKLARGLEDALTGVVYVDDAQIVDEHLAKRYGDVERTEVTLAAVDDLFGP